MNSSLPTVLEDNSPQQQKLRIQHACMLGAGLLVHMIVCWIAFKSDYLDISSSGFFLLFSLTASLFIIFVLLIYFGWNLHFSDPDLSLAQMFFAITVVVISSYFATEMKPVIVLAGLAMILVGTNRLNRKALLAFTVYGIVIYLVLIAYAFVNKPEQIQWLRESIVAVAFSLMLIIGPILLRHEMLVINGSLREKNRQLAIALDQMSEQASIDELTGSYNRRHLTQFLRLQKAMADRGNHIFAICFIDLDHFKNVNDIFGHNIGDRVLRDFARIAKSVTREADCVARYGGEEFLMVFGGVHEVDALVAAERIGALLQELQINESQPDYRITASMGITEYQAEEEIEVILDRADSALYEAKKAGRNRIVISKPDVRKSTA